MKNRILDISTIIVILAILAGVVFCIKAVQDRYSYETYLKLTAGLCEGVTPGENIIWTKC